jgi:hypothetical protein
MVTYGNVCSHSVRLAAAYVSAAPTYGSLLVLTVRSYQRVHQVIASDAEHAAGFVVRLDRSDIVTMLTLCDQVAAAAVYAVLSHGPFPPSSKAG